MGGGETVAQRTTDQIFGRESAQAEPVEPESESLDSDVSPQRDEGFETEPQGQVTKPEAEKAQPVAAKAAEEHEGDGEHEDPDPADYSVAGLRKVVSKERKLSRAADKKARELEREAADLKRRIADLEQHGRAQAEKREAKPDPKPEDLDGAYYQDPRGYTEQAVQKALQESEQRRFQADEIEMAEEHEDYQSVIQKFVAIAQQDPRVGQRYWQASNKPRFAYNYAKRIEKAQADSQAKTRSELEAEIKAKYGIQDDETGERPAESSSKKPSIPKPSIAGARGTGVGTSSAQRKRTPDEIYGRPQ